MRSLKFVFMILILLSIANAAMAQEVLFRIDKNNQLWITPPGASTVLAGTIETIPKGTLLYHWGTATPEQAQAWNDAGKISPELLERLKQGTGFVGGGFYVSRDATDSIQYGNTQVVIELTKDIQVVSGAPGFGWGKKLWPTLAKAGLSGVIVNHTQSWINIVDAEALTKEFVATSEFHKKNHLKQWTTPNLLHQFFDKFPDLKTDPFYQELLQKTEKLYADVISKDRKTAVAALTDVFANGNESSQRAALAIIHSHQSFAALSEAKTVDLALNALESKSIILAQEALETLTYLVRKPQQINSYVFAKAHRNLHLMTQLLPVMKKQLTLEKYSAILVEAEYALEKQNPYYVKEAIKELQAEGKWNPPNMCQWVFR